MRGKVTRGVSFRGLLNYLLADGRGEIIGGNMVSTDKAGLSAEFGLTRSARPDVAKPVEHVMLSLPPGDELTAGQWRDVAAAYLRKMDIRNNQYCIIRHSDKQHQHVHIVVNRITQDGGLWYGERELLRTIEACRQLEAENDYLRDTSDRSGKNKRFRPSYREQGRKRRGQDITRQRIHDAIQRTLDGSPRKLTPRELIEALRREGIEARPNISATGRLNGFGFAALHGAHYSGAKVGAKWAQLRQRIDYQPARDNAYLMQLIGRRPQDMAFSPVEFGQYCELIDRYIANPTRAIDLRDDIKRIGVNRLLRGAREMQATHYEQLAALCEEQRRTWAKIRAQRPPMLLSSRDIGSVALMMLASPQLAALVLLPYAIDALIRTTRRVKAAQIAAEIQRIRDEIKQGTIRQQAVRGMERCEVITDMQAKERTAIIKHTQETITETAKAGKDFREYIGYINTNGIRDTEITYDELAAMYAPNAWVGNYAVLRGVRDMVNSAAQAASERPENRAIYILPLVFDVCGRVGVGTIGAKELEMAIKRTEQQCNDYMRKDLDEQWKELNEEAVELDGTAKEITEQRRSVERAKREIEPKKPNFRGKIVLTQDEYDYYLRTEREREQLEVEAQRHNINRWRVEQERDRLERENRTLARDYDEMRERYVIQVDGNRELQQHNNELSAENQSMKDFIAENRIVGEYKGFCRAREETTETIDRIVSMQPEL